MMSYLIDTNCILRYILNDIPKQADLIEKHFLQAKEGKITILVPLLIIGELIYALTKFYKFNKKKVIENIDSILHLEYLDIEERDLLQEALELYSPKNISFVDAIFCAQARLEGRKLLTFDERLKKL